ncbi:carbon-nitrogen family hydrolase [Natronomonas halophila]|uniref:carbon-nitrogen family hydrolase n=1 Tax=Natronomonas halophila TaxID=2747817 RepID=UPI0015B71E61|nr:carbon-nitrogen family hydrolase [Natronomonas halophila]QLD85233.1 carbon-nitrogen family hydrolase [Natronomonas halophila]
MRLALAQLRIEAAAVDDNVDRAVSTIATAAEEGADLVALPEIFNVGYFAFESYERASEPLGGDTHQRVREAAIEHDVSVLAGTIVEDLAGSADAGEAVPAESGLANTAVLFDSDGKRRLVYRKHHLFGYDSAEAELLVPGEQLPTADIGGHTVGVTTCYDLRFPELYRRLVDDGATMVLVPSAWPYPRVEHWKLLPRARAVENLLYVGAVNGSAAFDDASLVGRSTVYDPWGTPLASSDDDATIVYADCDPERVDDVRTDFPALRDRR